MSETVKSSNVRDSISGIHYLVEDVPAAMMIPDPEDEKHNEDSRMVVIMQAKTNKLKSKQVDKKRFETLLHKTVDDIALLP